MAPSNQLNDLAENLRMASLQATNHAQAVEEQRNVYTMEIDRLQKEVTRLKTELDKALALLKRGLEREHELEMERRRNDHNLQVATLRKELARVTTQVNQPLLPISSPTAPGSASYGDSAMTIERLKADHVQVVEEQRNAHTLEVAKLHQQVAHLTTQLNTSSPWHEIEQVIALLKGCHKQELASVESDHKFRKLDFERTLAEVKKELELE